MKIMLIRHDDEVILNSRLPKELNRKQGILPHLGMGYIAAVLTRAGHSVRFLDAMVLRLGAQDILLQAKNYEPDLIGLTAKTPSAQTTLELAKILASPRWKIIVGGAHTSIFPKETLGFDFIDYVALGEGEEVMLQLCESLQQGKSPRDILGLGSKENGEMVINTAVLVRDLNSLPFPSYQDMPMNKYSSIIGLHPVGTMMASRGCPYKCAFCYKTPSDRQYRFRDPRSIVEEMIYLQKEFKAKEIMFYDDLMPPNYVKGLCEEILRRGLKVAWETPQRVDCVDLESLKLMKRAGCRMLRLGVEQGDPDMMQRIEKKITPEKVRQAFAWCKQVGIETFAYFIIGYLGETAETMSSTIKLAIELNPRFIMFTKAVPLPATKLHDEAVAQGLIEPDYWQRYSLFQDVPELKDLVADADEWVGKAYREFYLRPRKMLDQIKHIRTWQDLKKNATGFLGILKT